MSIKWPNKMTARSKLEKFGSKNVLKYAWITRDKSFFVRFYNSGNQASYLFEFSVNLWSDKGIKWLLVKVKNYDSLVKTEVKSMKNHQNPS